MAEVGGQCPPVPARGAGPECLSADMYYEHAVYGLSKTLLFFPFSKKFPQAFLTAWNKEGKLRVQLKEHVLGAKTSWADRESESQGRPARHTYQTHTRVSSDALTCIQSGIQGFRVSGRQQAGRQEKGREIVRKIAKAKIITKMQHKRRATKSECARYVRPRRAGRCSRTGRPPCRRHCRHCRARRRPT